MRAEASRMSYMFALLFIAFVLGGSVVTLFLPAPGVLDSDEPFGEAAERLATTDDMLAACIAFDRMMVRKGLVTDEQLDLIRRGTRSRAVVTGMRATGNAREDHREVELDVMVKRPAGGQFPAREKALIPASALRKVSPGSVIDTYYRVGDESAVAICVPAH